MGRRFFSLDEKLGLRTDSWSGGAARVMTRCGLREPSFAQAAEGYREATGGKVSGASVRRVTQSFGRAVQTRQEREAVQAAEIGPFEEVPQERWLELQAPLEGAGNLSSDGTMILVREEGWKEVKVAAFSQVQTLPPRHPDRRKAQREGTQQEEKVVRLSAHSYCAGLWDADTFGGHQYVEGLRRGFDRVPRASSVNDGAVWIARVTDTNFLYAQRIVDWSHSTQHLWAVGQAVYGEGTPQATSWVQQRETELWAGAVENVVHALQRLDLEREDYPDAVRQAPQYFASRTASMRYADFRAQGYPIGSGTVESAARNVVQPRMRRPGRGWQHDNANAMLAALGEFHSGRLHWAWQLAASA